MTAEVKKLFEDNLPRETLDEWGGTFENLMRLHTLSIAQQVFAELDNEYPYKKAGDRESFTEYREGFSDGIDLIRSRVKEQIETLS